MTQRRRSGDRAEQRPRLDESLEGHDPALAEVVDRGDLDDLIREVDRRVGNQDWPGLGRLIVRARRSHERGRQLWPAATYASHCMALAAPAEWAVASVFDGLGTLGLGPLTEVAGIKHTWAELEPWLPETAERYVIAHERGLRGDLDVSGPEHAIGGPADPFEHDPALGAWEIDQVPADYTAWECSAPRPPLRPLAQLEIHAGTGRDTGRATGLDQPSDPSLTAPGERSLHHLVAAWDGDGVRRLVTAGEGDLARVIGSLTFGETVSATNVSASAAIADWTWIASSGGPQGRRRGGAIGRFDALWTAASILGHDEDWPIPLDELGDDLETLEFWVLRASSERSGSRDATDWVAAYAVIDPVDGLAWGLRCWVESAVDTPPPSGTVVIEP